MIEVDLEVGHDAAQPGVGLFAFHIRAIDEKLELVNALSNDVFLMCIRFPVGLPIFWLENSQLSLDTMVAEPK